MQAFQSLPINDINTFIDEYKRLYPHRLAYLIYNNLTVNSSIPFPPSIEDYILAVTPPLNSYFVDDLLYATDEQLIQYFQQLNLPFIDKQRISHILNLKNMLSNPNKTIPTTIVPPTKTISTTKTIPTTIVPPIKTISTTKPLSTTIVPPTKSLSTTIIPPIKPLPSPKPVINPKPIMTVPSPKAVINPKPIMTVPSPLITLPIKTISHPKPITMVPSPKPMTTTIPSTSTKPLITLPIRHSLVISKPIGQNSIENIPYEVIQIIMGMSNIDDMINFCRTNKLYNKLCKSRYGQELIVSKIGITQTPETLSDKQLLNLYNIITDNITGTLYMQGGSSYKPMIPKMETITKMYENVKSLEFGEHVMFILLNDGTVYGVGENKFGMLGVGNEKHLKTFSKIGIDDVKQISVGGNFTLFLNNKGQVFRCGNNDGGQLGNTGKRKRINDIEQIPELSNIKSISAGEKHSLFLDYNGKVYSCGRNMYGELGLQEISVYVDHKDNKNSSSKIININLLPTISKIRASERSSLFLTKDGLLYYCGMGRYINGGIENIKTPEKVFGLPPILDIKTSINYGQLLLTYTGEVYMFERTETRKIQGLTGIIDVAFKPKDLLLCLSFNGTVYEYDTKTNNVNKIYEYPTDGIKIGSKLNINSDNFIYVIAN
jgi:hypothetical protein